MRVDTRGRARKTSPVFAAGSSQRRIARTLNAAYATGLLSEDTFVRRVDQLVARTVIEPRGLIGDLNLRAGRRRRTPALLRTITTEARARLGGRTIAPVHASLLALDWTGADSELSLGRHRACDVTLADLGVSRRHAHLRFRDGRWILQDLESTNGTTVNGVRVGRCELRPGDVIGVGETRLLVD
jgi:hypothetical protein